MSEKKFLMGNEVAARAAQAAGAKAMYGYPITPASEVLHYWSGLACSEEGKKDGIIFTQAEDETGAGFMLLGGVAAGVKSFTATAGPGHVLMQDAFSMAEAMRIPSVAIIMQRGGPSTSTVIFSQQEVNLTCFGGNGNGFRIVYSPSSLQELYDYGIKVFDTAWRHRFPTFLLGDGYMAKMMGEVELWTPEERGMEMAPTEAYMLERERKVPLTDVVPSPEIWVRHVDGVEYACIRNCLNLEEETLAVNMEIKEAWDKMAKDVTEFENYGPKDAKTLIVAHGVVAAAARAAVDEMNDNGGSVRLFRPITLNPFPYDELKKTAEGADRIIVAEAAINQLSRFVKESLYGLTVPITEYFRPSIGILAEDIIEVVKSVKQ
ncbi:MAG: ferredoxin oxidoreductase [Patescibacteria group bacterium]|nr:ferredoxin oxidoreductase [Patescibacteria group bacterium]